MNTHGLYLICRSQSLSIIFLIFLTRLKGHFNDLWVFKSHPLSNTHSIFWSRLSPTNSLVSLLTSAAREGQRGHEGCRDTRFVGTSLGTGLSP